MVNTKKILVIEDDPGWITDIKSYFKESTCLIDKGNDYINLLNKNLDMDLVLIDFELKGMEKNEAGILEDIKKLNSGACIGLLSGVKKGGFSAKDAEIADFYLDKDDYLDREEAFDKISKKWNEFMKDACLPRIRTEWDDLRSVIVHTPTSELRYVDSENQTFLMEERPDEERAAEEHYDFIKAIQKNSNARILEIRNLAEDVFKLTTDDEERQEMLAELIFNEEYLNMWKRFNQANISFPHIGTDAIDDAKQLSPSEIVNNLYNGWNSTDWKRYQNRFGSEHVHLLYEMNNAYFTRDPGVTLDGLFVVSKMTRLIRKREARLLNVILKKHPWFFGADVLSYSSGAAHHRIEGGDVVAIGPNRLAVGWSERTSYETIEDLAKHLLYQYGYKQIFVIPIPKRRAFMHLDTVFSLVGEKTAVCHPEALEMQMGFWIFEKEETKGNDGIISNAIQESFIDHLKEKFGFIIVETAGGHPGLARSEQFTDATNCLAIGNNRVVGYTGNRATNEALKKAGVEVIEVEGYELVKGRGGPRCMTMPVSRW